MKNFRWIKFVSVLMTFALFYVCLVTKWDYTGGWEGLYLLRGDSWGFEVTDDIFPENVSRFIVGIPFGGIAGMHHRITANNSTMHVAWNTRQGRGNIKNVFPDGNKFLINLSRFKNLDGTPQYGVFLGGGLSRNDPDYNPNDRNETGMSYFDGTRWFHIWCYVNEAIASLAKPDIILGPSKWQFTGSRVIEKSDREITIESDHTTVLDGVPVKIKKFLFYEAGNTFCTVVTRIINIGERPVTILYMYGDEPWLGDYGSSEGNVGWLRGGLAKTEQSVDVKANSFAGFFDYGNDLAGEQHIYTQKANFIEWEMNNLPQCVYFSNLIGRFSPPRRDGQKIALSSPDSRFLGLQWKQTLKPNQSYSFKLAIGMADNDPVTGYPIKPRTGLNY